jgi:DNA-binding FrmR family transcriptional regulator
MQSNRRSMKRRVAPEVLHPIAAARGGINGPMGEVIEDPVREHIVEPTKPSERFEGGKN